MIPREPRDKEVQLELCGSTRCPACALAFKPVLLSELKGHGSEVTSSHLEECLRLVILMSKCFGYNESKLDLRKTINKWGLLEKEIKGADPWIKICKYKISAFYASQVDCTLPPAPFKCQDLPHVLIGSTWGRWWRRYRTDACRRHRHEFLSSLLQLKKGCPRASQDGLQAARLDTFNQLVQAPFSFEEMRPGDWMDESKFEKIEDFDHRLSRVQTIHEVRRTSREAFRDFRITPDQMLKLNFPSTSANYYYSRNVGGAVTRVADTLRFEDSPARLQDGTLTMEERLRHFAKVPAKYGGVRFGRRWDDSQERFVGSLEGYCGSYADEMRERQMSKFLIEEALHETNCVETVALAEAFKVRVITKGPAIRGFVLMNLQKLLHGHLRSQKVFQLIGRPCSESICTDVLGSLLPSERWLSGDYKAATDGLPSYLSEAAAEEIWDTVTDWRDWAEHGDLWFKIKRLFIDALTRHEILHPDVKQAMAKDTDFSSQRNGQLMGSIVSFPILCIVNAALCRKAMELGIDDCLASRGDSDRYPKARKLLRDLPLLINGDDCVFPADRFVHEAWLQMCKCFGMKPSVGKYYWSSEFMNINSTTYLYRKIRRIVMSEFCQGLWTYSERYEMFETVKYINFGLVFHQKRSTGVMGAADVMDEYCSFSSNSKDLLATLPDTCIDVMYDYFIYRFKQLAEKMRLRLPFFIPCEYGGVGLKPYGRHQPSKMDKSICKWLKLKGTYIPRVRADSCWSVHRNVQKIVKQQFGNLPLVEDSPGWDNFYGRAVMNEFLRSASDVEHHHHSQVFSEGSKLSAKALRPIEKIWGKMEKLYARGGAPSCKDYDPWREPHVPLVPLFLGSDWRKLELRRKEFGVTTLYPSLPEPEYIVGFQCKAQRTPTVVVDGVRYPTLFSEL